MIEYSVEVSDVNGEYNDFEFEYYTNEKEAFEKYEKVLEKVKELNSMINGKIGVKILKFIPNEEEMYDVIKIKEYKA